MEFTGQYLTYDEYKALGGNLDQTPFNLLEFEARKEVDKYTFNRLVNLKTQNQDVKLCVYALISKIKKYNDISYVSSVNTDGYSESYSKPATKEEQKERYCIIETYLINCKLDNGTPYLYRG